MLVLVSVHVFPLDNRLVSCKLPKNKAIQRLFQAWLGLLDGNSQCRHPRTYLPLKQVPTSEIRQSACRAGADTDHEINRI